MRIAQVAPLFESVPPQTYGGTERVVSSLTEELVKRGHDVTLFASGDSLTDAKLVSVCRRSVRTDPTNTDPFVYLLTELGLVYDHAAEFDLIHSHVDYFAFPLTRHVKTPTVTTLHGRLDLPELQTIYRAYAETNLISISNHQRAPLPYSCWLATVYNGIPVEDYTPRRKPGDYLAFLGRIAPEKRVDIAIEIAKRAGMRLIIAAKVDKADRDYFVDRIEPLLADPLIEFIGEIDQKEKNEFLGKAYALLFPIDWPEPFGLVMTEAMACGTPVIAMRRGSVPEIVAHKKTGFICDSIEQMLKAVEEVARLDRLACRRYVETHFSVQVMTDAYEAAYKKLLTSTSAAVPLAIDGGSLHSGNDVIKVKRGRRPEGC